MKICLSILFILSYSLSSAQQAGDGYRLDSSYCESYDPDIAFWDKSSRFYYLYNNNNIETEYYSQVWRIDLNTWFNSFRNLSEHDADGHLTRLTSQTEGDSPTQWENYFRHEYAWEGDKQVEDLSLDWDTIALTWHPYSRRIKAYDAQGLLTQTTFQLFDPLSGDWENCDKLTYTYNDDDLLTEEVFQQYDPSTNSWKNEKKEVSGYDGNGNLLERLYLNWSVGIWLIHKYYFWEYGFDNRLESFTQQYYEDGNWYNDNRSVYEYQIDNLVSNIEYQDWDIGSLSWKVLFKYHYIYDGNLDLTDYITEKWSTTINDFFILESRTYAYDDFHNRTGTLTETNEYNTGLFKSKYQCDHYYSAATLPTTYIHAGEDLCAYKNLVTDVLTLNCTALSDQASLYIRIMDMTGRVVIHTPFRSGESISMEGVTPGLYFFQVLQKQEVLASGKVVRQ